MSIEAAGPLAHYDVGTYNPPFTIKASPFQLRGLASNVVRTCVYPSKDPWGKEKKDSGGQGGFVTDKIQNLADYIAVADNLDTYRKQPLGPRSMTGNRVIDIYNDLQRRTQPISPSLSRTKVVTVLPLETTTPR